MKNVLIQLRDECTQRPWLAVVLVFLIFLTAMLVFELAFSDGTTTSTYVANAPTTDAYAANDGSATTTVTLNGYTLSFTTGGDLSSLRIFNGNKLVFRAEPDTSESFSPLFLTPAQQAEVDKSIMNLDANLPNPSASFTDASDLVKRGSAPVLTNGAPVLALDGASGSADSCEYEMDYVIELSHPIKTLWQQEGCAGFATTTKNGAHIINYGDETFEFWSTDNVHSPQPNVVLSLQSGTYKPDFAIMRSPAPSLAQLKAEAEQWTTDGWENGKCVKNADGFDTCFVPWAYALDLIYSGNAQSAKKYLDLAWRQNTSFLSEDSFVSQFLSELAQSPYYTTILSLNGGKIF